jgi:aryl-alcohol dehydrogenase-like predicted oxidoreductase
VAASLTRLKTRRIDRYLVHAPRDLARFGPLLVEALERERRRGRIGQFGVSAYTCEEARSLLDYPALTILQHPLNLLDRRLPTHAVFADLKARGIAIEARSVLLQGLLTLAPDDPVARRLGASAVLTALRHCLAEHALSATEIALPFVFAAGADSALVGVESPEQLTALCSAAHTKLHPGLLDAIDALEAPTELIDPRRWPG